MSRIKCRECGKLAEVSMEGKMYCWECAPKVNTPVVIEESIVRELVIDQIPPVVKREFASTKPLSEECFKETVTKKSWWEKFLGFFS